MPSCRRTFIRTFILCFFFSFFLSFFLYFLLYFHLVLFRCVFGLLDLILATDRLPSCLTSPRIQMWLWHRSASYPLSKQIKSNIQLSTTAINNSYSIRNRQDQTPSQLISAASISLPCHMQHTPSPNSGSALLSSCLFLAYLMSTSVCFRSYCPFCLFHPIRFVQFIRLFVSGYSIYPKLNTSSGSTPTNNSPTCHDLVHVVLLVSPLWGPSRPCSVLILAALVCI